ncbi:MAG TPA: hypothetical protein DCY13_20710, partial [Verrucomicrobiales bacterium]|nr:hypothetical protein [Verrucomicrobiales bacterium]
ANAALGWMLEAKLGIAPPPEPATIAVEGPERFAGNFESESFWARIDVEGGRLTADISGQPAKVRAVGPLQFVLDSRIHSASPLTFEASAEGAITGFTLGGQKFSRVSGEAPALPQHWRKALGSYGHDFIPLIVSQRHGHLYVMTENMVDYRLTPVNLHVCDLPRGMYVDEEAVFLTDRRGRVHGINFAGMIFSKRN